MADAARARGLGWQALQVKDVEELMAAISDARADALLLIATQMIYRRPERIAEAAVAHRLPIAVTGAPARDPVAGGILCCYTPGSRSSTGAPRSASPDPARREARRHSGRATPALRLHHQPQDGAGHGLTIPRAVRLHADEVIE